MIADENAEQPTFWWVWLVVGALAVFASRGLTPRFPQWAADAITFFLTFGTALPLHIRLSRTTPPRYGRAMLGALVGALTVGALRYWLR